MKSIISHVIWMVNAYLLTVVIMASAADKATDKFKISPATTGTILRWSSGDSMLTFPALTGPTVFRVSGGKIAININLQTGDVTVDPPDATMSDASREFWFRIAEAFPSTKAEICKRP